MRQVVLTLVVLSLASPAAAQFGALDRAQKGLKKLEQARDEIVVTEDQERQIGAEVSEKLRARFGVVQDAAVHRYVASVGLLLARETSRAGLPWTFIVLDTDGVNAFASPGGYVHITRGALALAANEAQLAGVLGHEIAHITERHTINAIRKSKAVQLGAERSGSRREIVTALVGPVYEMVIENSFDRGDENEADQKGIALAAAVGYAPAALADFLSVLAARNRGQRERNGLFASHPETTSRMEKIRRDAARLTPTALVAARYKAHVKYAAKDLASVPQAPEGAAGLAGSTSGKTAEPAPKKKKLSLGLLKPTSKSEGESAQVSASGGARGVGPDRNATGGPNPALVNVTISAAELAAFQKGIA